ncbi:MAG: type IX secretion system outer membrane channel protein PorV [Bacteroidota bacterium]
MNIKRIIFVLSSVLCGISSSQLHAQIGRNGQSITVNTVTTSVPFVRIAPDARAGAMGDVAIATAPDMNSIYQNASKLAFVQGDYGVAIHYTPWLRALVNDINMVTINGYYKIKQKQSIALGLKYFSLGQITFTDNTGQTIRDFRPYEMAVDGHYARALSKNFGVAIGLRFIYSNLANNITPQGGETIKPGYAGSGDLSFYYKQPLKVGKMNSELSLGLALTNIGSKITYTNSTQKDFIPANFGVGIGYKIDINEHNSIGIYYDLNKLMVPTPDGSPNDSTRRATGVIKGMFTSFNDAPGWYDANGNYVKGSRTKEELRELMHGVALEYWYSKLFAVRAGYFYEHKTKGARQFLTVGVGVKYSIFGLDFSYLVPTSTVKNPLDNTLRFSLLFDFNKSANDPLFKKKDASVTP